MMWRNTHWRVWPLAGGIMRAPNGKVMAWFIAWHAFGERFVIYDWERRNAA